MITLNHITKSFDSKTIISDFSAEFEEGLTYCIMGKSGVGKTTLMNIISNLKKPDSGIVTGVSEMKCSYIFQENRLIPWLSAYDNIRYVTENTKEIESSLEMTGLSEDKDKTPGELSGGMQRRLAIARALAYGGDCFFIDEPISGLDKTTADEIIAITKNALKGKTAFIVTHSPEEAYILADRIIFVPSSPVTECKIFEKSDFSSPEEILKLIL